MTETKSEFVPVTSDQLEELLTEHAQANEPVIVFGPPGCGKTEVAIQVAKKVGKPVLVPLNLALCDSTDLKGLPAFSRRDDKGEHLSMTWVQDDFWLWHADNVGTVLMDEYGQGGQSTQAASASIIHEKRIDKIFLHPDTWVCCTTNRVEDKAAVNRMPTQVADRGYKYEVGYSADAWIRHEINSPDMDNLTLRFIRMKGDEAFSFDPARLINTTMRTWSVVGRKIKKLTANNQPVPYAMIAGRLGKGFATELLTFRDLAPTLPSKEEILLNPSSARLPEEPSAKFLVSDMLADFLSPQNCEAIMVYGKRLPKEFQALMVKSATKRDPTLFDTETFTKWAVEFSDVLR